MPKSKTNQRSKKSGFTLLELLVVIGVISILMAFAVSNYTNAQQKARDSIRKSELKQIQNALELYKNDQMPQAYPDSANMTTLLATLVAGGYMKSGPIDPRERGSDGSWEDYTYTRTAALTYSITACLENVNDSTGGVDCATSRGKLYTLTQP